MISSADRLLGVEALRGFAAVYVYVGHAVMSLGRPEGVMAIPFKFGGEAVILFFLISGFTVTYSHLYSTDQSFKDYFRRRFIRIYPIFLLSLLISAISYPERGLQWTGLMGNIFMLQEYSLSRFGVLVDTYRNPALWSLSYEWWFYIFFWPIWTWIHPKRQAFWVGIVSSSATFAYFYFKFQPFLFISYLSIWWMGHELAVSYRRNGGVPGFRKLLWLMLPAAAFTVVLGLSAFDGELISVNKSHLLELRQYLVALALFALASWIGWERISRLGRFSFFSKHLSSISYGIYALHFPIILLIEKFIGTGWLGFVCSVPAVLAIAWMAEKQLQPLAHRLLPRAKHATASSQEIVPRG